MPKLSISLSSEVYRVLETIAEEHNMTVYAYAKKILEDIAYIKISKIYSKEAKKRSEELKTLLTSIIEGD